MTDPETAVDRLVCDVNAIVIASLSDHPGHDYIFPHIRAGFDGDARLLVFDYAPFRVQYVLTTHYDVETYRARNVVQRFCDQPIELIAADDDTIQDAYDVSASKNHDVYDSFLVALARAHDADAILTTDRDFERLCEDEPFEYWNPVPEDVLERFHAETA